MKFSEIVDFGITFQKITHRGTQAIRSKLTLPNWASEEFKKFQTTQISSVPSNFIIHVGRGFRIMKLCDIPERARSSTKNRILVINRGTKTRHL